MLKRGLDIVASFFGIVITSPILLAAAVAIRLGSEGPVFYRATRVGRYGKPFTMLKFRSMVANADSIGGASTPDDDSRITSIGKLLRKFKIDELPQLINVLLGEMSLVGPRPNVQFDVDKYTKDEQSILSVRPGITDFASIRYSNEGEILNGSKDPDRAYDELIRPGKIFLQLRYVRESSFLLDLKLIWWTIATIALKPFGYEIPRIAVPSDFADDQNLDSKRKLAAGT